MPNLISCTYFGSGKRVLGFSIGYDQRTGNNNQVVFSDQRVRRHEMEYSVQVSSRSTPKPFEPVLQQLAYVVKDGHGTFYRDGKPFSEQKETKRGSTGALFAYALKKAGDADGVRIGIGGAPTPTRVQQALMARLVAVRIYDRAVTAAELDRNRAAASLRRSPEIAVVLGPQTDK
jgi:hypothetical protein